LSTYNRCIVDLECPRCRHRSTVEVDLYLGETSMMATLELGAPYPFKRGASPKDGGAVEGIFSDAGYTECTACQRDFFCSVEIRAGHLTAICANGEIPPYRPDRVAETAATCPRCGANETRHFEYDNLSVGWLLCDGCYGHTATHLDPEAKAYRCDNLVIPVMQR
jgi:hypothetical protein